MLGSWVIQDKPGVSVSMNGCLCVLAEVHHSSETSFTVQSALVSFLAVTVTFSSKLLHNKLTVHSKHTNLSYLKTRLHLAAKHHRSCDLDTPEA